MASNKNPRPSERAPARLAAAYEEHVAADGTNKDEAGQALIRTIFGNMRLPGMRLAKTASRTCRVRCGNAFWIERASSVYDLLETENLCEHRSVPTAAVLSKELKRFENPL